jgi:M6 family metalloprotease-like protein
MNTRPLKTVISATLAVVALSTLAPANAKTPEEVTALNNQVLQLQASLIKTKKNKQATALRRDASSVLARRATSLQQLAEKNPDAAARLAFPASVLSSLSASFPAAAQSLEKRGKFSGEFEYLIEDDLSLATHKDVYRLHGKAGVVNVKFSGGAPGHLKSGLKATLDGVQIGDLLIASEVEVLSSMSDEAAVSCGPKGPQKVIAILVNLPDYKLGTGMTPDFVKGALMGNAYAGALAPVSPDRNLDDFWRQNSDGQTYVDTTITTAVGPFQLSSNYNTNSTGASYCDYYGLGAEAIKLADSQVDFGQYNRVLFITPANGACSWAGVANVGCRVQSSPGDGSFNASSAWQRSGSMGNRGSAVQLTSHELGHNLGLSHASSRDFGTEALGVLGTQGTLSEYGDPHSTMGSWNYGFYASSHAANQLGWLAAGSQYQVVERAGTYVIQNYEARPAGMKALKIRRGTGNEAWLWVEARRNVAPYSSALNASNFNGVLVHYQDSLTGGKSHLLDFTPETTTFGDAPLALGQTWTDPYSNLSLTVSAVSATGATVTVNYGALPCTPMPPTLTLAQGSVATEAGKPAAFSLSVKNNDSLGCSDAPVALASAPPAGLSGTFSPSALTIAPGQVASASYQLPVPSGFTPGSYGVGFTASTSSSTASANGTLTITAPANTLSLSISGKGTVTFNNPVKSCTTSCATNYPGGSINTVTLTAKPATKQSFAGWSGACVGTATTCTVTVTDDLSVTATFKAATGGKKR